MPELCVATKPAPSSPAGPAPLFPGPPHWRRRPSLSPTARPAVLIMHLDSFSGYSLQNSLQPHLRVSWAQQ